MVQDKVVFITGAASGIGFAMGKEFAKKGAKVVLTDMNTKKLDEAVSGLKGDGYNVIGEGKQLCLMEAILHNSNKEKMCLTLYKG